jgi:drug/metabolite transporter (DMT)-like permease
MIAIFLGWAVLSEEVTLRVVLGALAIVLSVAAVVRREGGAAPQRETAPEAPVAGSR